jgi:hypothetical protein
VNEFLDSLVGQDEDEEEPEWAIASMLEGVSQNLSPEEAEARRSAYNARDVKLITYEDMQACPVHSWWHAHYRIDGSCRCDEVEEAEAGMAKIEADYVKTGAAMRHHVWAARRNLEQTRGWTE